MVRLKVSGGREDGGGTNGGGSGTLTEPIYGPVYSGDVGLGSSSGAGLGLILGAGDGGEDGLVKGAKTDHQGLATGRK